jgi:hypothetical protein
MNLLVFGLDIRAIKVLLFMEIINFQESGMKGIKMIAPIIITTIIVLYYLGFAYLCITVSGLPTIAKILGGGIPLILVGVAIYVLSERIKEIRSGEEDDLSKY